MSVYIGHDESGPKLLKLSGKVEEIFPIQQYVNADFVFLQWKTGDIGKGPGFAAIVKRIDWFKPVSAQTNSAEMHLTAAIVNWKELWFHCLIFLNTLHSLILDIKQI